MKRADRIELVIHQRPGITGPEIVRLLDEESGDVFAVIRWLVEHRRIEARGQRRPAGSRGGAQCRCYYLAPGRIPRAFGQRLELPGERPPLAPAPRRRLKAGSGQIAGPCYARGSKWGAGRA